MPPLLGVLNVGGLDWHFTPAVPGVSINGNPIGIGDTVAVRPLSTIAWREIKIVGKVPRYAEYQRLITQCPICSFRDRK